VPGQPEPVVPDENATPPERPKPPVRIGKVDYQDTGADSGKISLSGLGDPIRILLFYDEEQIGSGGRRDGTWSRDRKGRQVPHGAGMSGHVWPGAPRSVSGVRQRLKWRLRPMSLLRRKICLGSRSQFIPRLQVRPDSLPKNQPPRWWKHLRGRDRNPSRPILTVFLRISMRRLPTPKSLRNRRICRPSRSRSIRRSRRPRRQSRLRLRPPRQSQNLRPPSRLRR
jgi:hypothetical protein